MKLVKTYKLFYGNDELRKWEEECKNIKSKNNEIEASAPKITRKFFLVKNWLFGEDAKYAESDEIYLKIIGISCVPSVKDREEIFEWSTTDRRGNIKFHKYSVIYIGDRLSDESERVDLLPYPEKPDIELLNAQKAIQEIQKINPKFYVHPYSVIYGVKDGFYQYQYIGKVLKIETQQVTNSSYEKNSQGEYIQQRYTIYTRVSMWKELFEYKVYPDSLEVWIGESFSEEDWTPEGRRYRHYVSDGYSDSHEDGFMYSR